MAFQLRFPSRSSLHQSPFCLLLSNLLKHSLESVSDHRGVLNPIQVRARFTFRKNPSRAKPYPITTKVKSSGIRGLDHNLQRLRLAYPQILPHGCTLSFARLPGLKPKVWSAVLGCAVGEYRIRSCQSQHSCRRWRDGLPKSAFRSISAGAVRQNQRLQSTQTKPSYALEF